MLLCSGLLSSPPAMWLSAIYPLVTFEEPLELWWFSAFLSCKEQENFCSELGILNLGFSHFRASYDTFLRGPVTFTGLRIFGIIFCSALTWGKLSLILSLSFTLFLSPLILEHTHIVLGDIYGRALTKVYILPHDIRVTWIWMAHYLVKPHQCLALDAKLTARLSRMASLLSQPSRGPLREAREIRLELSLLSVKHLLGAWACARWYLDDISRETFPTSTFKIEAYIVLVFL